MQRTDTKSRKTGRVVALLIALVVLGAALVLGTRSLVRSECELCVTFRGVTTCRRGSGTSQQEAMQAAQKAACAIMASGMNESIACDNTPPTNVQCSGD